MVERRIKTKPIWKIVKTAFKALIVAVMLLLVVFNGYKLIQRYVYGNGMPTVFGYGSAVVVSGSMEPELRINDLVIVKAQQGYELGDVIMFYDSSAGAYVTHRIVSVSAEGFGTQGDANNAPDQYLVPTDAVVGKVVGAMSGAGNVVSFLQSPAGMLACVIVLAVLWLVPDLVSRRKRDLSEEAEEESLSGREEETQASERGEAESPPPLNDIKEAGAAPSVAESVTESAIESAAPQEIDQGHQEE